MSTEIELKLRFPPQFAEYIKQLPILANLSIAEPENHHLYSIYYDTPDFILGKNHVALRLRKTGNRWMQTIKSGGSVHNGLHQHREYEYPVTTHSPEFEQISDQDLKTLFSDKKLRAVLKPIFITEFHRTSYLLEPVAGTRLECCFDEGIIKAEDKTEAINEIELELKTGEIAQLFQFSRLLQENCPFDLIPENTNKAGRGYALLSQS